MEESSRRRGGGVGRRWSAGAVLLVSEEPNVRSRVARGLLCGREGPGVGRAGCSELSVPRLRNLAEPRGRAGPVREAAPLPRESVRRERARRDRAQGYRPRDRERERAGQRDGRGERERERASANARGEKRRDGEERARERAPPPPPSGLYSRLCVAPSDQEDGPTEPSVSGPSTRGASTG